MWSTRRLNDMDPCPRSATPSVPTPPLFGAGRGVIPERRPTGGTAFDLELGNPIGLLSSRL
jgi:hypothetical protein